MATGPWKVDDMAHAIAWILKALLRPLLPPCGRHRAADLADDGPPAHQHTPTMSRPAHLPDMPVLPVAAERVAGFTIQFRTISGPPDGHGAAMARPYSVAYEQRRKSRPRVGVLLCAPHGMVMIR